MPRLEVDRDTLYEEVWATPMSRLAERYDVSDVALKKVCVKLSVPTPPRGYWAKLRHGHPVSRPPLPPPAKVAPRTHGFYVPEQGTRQEREEARAEGARALPLPAALPAGLREAPRVAVPATLRSPDPLVVKTRDALDLRDPDRYGRVRAYARGTIDVDVCPSSVPRALRIANSLIREARRLGFDFKAGPDESDGNARLLIEGETVPFGIREKVDREDRPLPENKRYSWGPKHAYAYHPTGRLALELRHTYSRTPRRAWRDASYDSPSTATRRRCTSACSDRTGRPPHVPARAKGGVCAGAHRCAPAHAGQDPATAHPTRQPG